MDRRRYLWAAASSIALAGCSQSSPAPSEDGTDTRTERGSGAPKETSVPVDAFDYPPGTDVRGIQEPRAVAETHYVNLNGQPYSMKGYVKSTVDGELGERRGIATNVDPEARTVDSRAEYENSDKDYVGERYVSGGTAFIRDRYTDETEYARQRIQDFSKATPPELLSSPFTVNDLANVLEMAEYTAEGTSEHLGEAVVEYTSSSYDHDGKQDGFSEIESFESQLSVGTDGLVHQFETRVRIPIEGDSRYDTRTVDYEYELTELGSVTITEPAWVRTVRQETTPVPSRDRSAASKNPHRIAPGAR